MTKALRWAWIGAAGVCGAVLILVLAVVTRDVPYRSEMLRQRIVSTLAEGLDRDVTLGDLSFKIFPRLHAEGSGLTISERRRAGVPPLIVVKTFWVDAGLLSLVRRHVDHLQISGLEINVPPDTAGDEDDTAARSGRAIPAPLDQGGSDGAMTGARRDTRIGRVAVEPAVVIDTLDSTDARLVIIPRKRDRASRTWAIHSLRMHDVGIAEAMSFQATLTNAIPPGDIVAEGSFGPWDHALPGHTPLSGSFVFAKADLGVFHGIAGTLSAHGSFGGSLARIDVHGETNTPDFTINVGGHPFALHAVYHSIIDGTNGDTRLERIDADFLKSTLIASGSVLGGPPGRPGHTVSLDVRMPKARLEDLMTMAVKTPKPPMTGALQLTTAFLLPPGETDVIDRLRLNGRFVVGQARFENYDVQTKIAELSHRSSGHPEDDGPDEKILSNFSGRFQLGRGRLQLPELTFAVPGAQVRLNGVYALKPETLDFKGVLLMDAKVSQTQKGFKALVLKMVDPLFNKPGGGSSIPIKITGPRNDPQFGVDMGRLFKSN